MAVPFGSIDQFPMIPFRQFPMPPPRTQDSHKAFGWLNCWTPVGLYCRLCPHIHWRKCWQMPTELAWDMFAHRVLCTNPSSLSCMPWAAAIGSQVWLPIVDHATRGKSARGHNSRLRLNPIVTPGKLACLCAKIMKSLLGLFRSDASQF